MPGSDRLIEQCESASRMLKALAHPQRLQILCLLSEGELPVGELARRCDAAQPVVSQFLARMKSEGWVTSKKQGNFAYYRIHDPKVRRLIKAMHRIFC